MKKAAVFIEITAIFGAFILRIWMVRSNVLTFAILAGMFASWRIHKDSLKDLGFALGESRNAFIIVFISLTAGIASFPLYRPGYNKLKKKCKR